VTRFQQLRLWFGRAPGPARGSAVAAGAIAVALVAWALVPSSHGHTTVATGAGGTTAASGSGAVSPGTAPSAAGGTTATSTAGAVSGGAGTTQTGTGGGGGGATAASSGGGGPAPAGGSGPAPPCGNLTATDQGVTATQIHLGIIIVNIEGSTGNGVFGVPSPDQQQADYDAVIDDINKNGGVACRKIAPTYYQGNPLDQSGEHAVCLQLVQDKVFAAIDTYGIDTPPSMRDCVPQNKIPLFDSAPYPASEAKQYAPYLFSLKAIWNIIDSNAVLAAHQLGWFDASFKKVGILEQDCATELNAATEAALAKIGITGSQIDRFDTGCITAPQPPSEIEQEVLQFKTDGVTHIIDDDAESNELADFSKDAQAQGYHPKYLVPDAGSVAVLEQPGSEPDPTNFEGALAITGTAYGAENSPGVDLGPQTSRCNAIMSSHGQPDMFHQGENVPGILCDILWMFKEAADHAPTLTRAALAQGLNQVGHYDLSFPYGPAEFSNGAITAGQYWRGVTFSGACGCWKVPDAAFHANLS